MKHHLLVIGLGLMLASCSSTTEISRRPSELELSEINREIRDLKVRVTTIYGNTVHLDSAYLHSDGIVGVHQETGTRIDIPQREISKFYSYGGFNSGGAWKGALLGALGGGLVGVVHQLAWSLGSWDRDFDEAPSYYLFAGIVGGGLIGGLIGGVESSDYYTYGEIESKEPDVRPPKMITLKLTTFQDETSDQVCIMWSGKSVWLPRSEIKIEREGEYILLTVPERLLEGK